MAGFSFKTLPETARNVWDSPAQRAANWARAAAPPPATLPRAGRPRQGTRDVLRDPSGADIFAAIRGNAAHF